MAEADTKGVVRVALAELVERLTAALRKLGFEPEGAALCARLMAETTRDGVYSHGVRRFPRFAAMVRSGVVRANSVPARVAQCGALERWDGQAGPGNTNAWRAMERAMELAREQGIGCVSLANTNHWMRGGTYGWQAAEAGFAGICWTNTMPNLPPWGGTKAGVGNNPLVLAAPRAKGPLVLDMAMSQFSYGALEAYRTRGEPLPVVGGFNAAGELTRDAAAIEETQRPLPVGFWKGSGLALLLDVIGAMAAGGRATCEIAEDPLRETGLTQMFVAIAPEAMGRSGDAVAEAAIAFLQSSGEAEGRKVRYPGEQTLKLREENLRLGVPVDAALWKELE